MKVILVGSGGDAEAGGRFAEGCGGPEGGDCSFITINCFFFGYERSKGGGTFTG